MTFKTVYSLTSIFYFYQLRILYRNVRST